MKEYKKLLYFCDISISYLKSKIICIVKFYSLMTKVFYKNNNTQHQ